MARVNVEQSALTDPRFNVLGRIIGRDRWSALGRMAMVWNMAQEREQYALPVQLVDALFDDVENFAAAIVQAGLGRLQDDNSLYIAGTVGRVEWLGRKRKAARENGALGGRPKTDEEPTTEPKKNQDRFPAADPPAPALAPVPAPAPVPPEEERAAPAPAQEVGAPKEETKGRRRTAITFEEGAIELVLSDEFLACVRRFDPEAKADRQRWARDFDALIRIDGRSVEQVREVMLHALTDERERRFTSCPAALRRNFTRIILATSAQPGQRTTLTNAPSPSTMRTSKDLGGRTWADFKRERKEPLRPTLSYLGLDAAAVEQLRAGHDDHCATCWASGVFIACADHTPQAVTA